MLLGSSLSLCGLPRFFEEKSTTDIFQSSWGMILDMEGATSSSTMVLLATLLMDIDEAGGDM